MTWAAITIALTAPAVYCVARFAVRLTLHSEWSALLALVVAVVWVNFLLAALL